LKIVLRCAVDACLPSGSRPAANEIDDDDDDDLADLVSNLNLGSITKPDRGSTSSAELRIIKGGTEVPQSSIIEIKTRSERSIANFDWGEAYPQLYLSQTPLLYLGVHNRGNFGTVTKGRVDDYVQVARESQPAFKGLKKALEDIQVLVQEHDLEGRISLVCKDGTLSVYERTSSDSCLPDNFMALFEQ
jgi:hypothetical protein